MQTDELIERAIRRYTRDSGPMCAQPSRGGCNVREDGVVVLENRHGVLAMYRPTRDAAGRVRLEQLELCDGETA